MKSKVLALLIPTLPVVDAIHVAEAYDKDGNKLDLCDKVDDLHHFSNNSAGSDSQSYTRLGFKGETQVNDQLTGYGQWEYDTQANNAKPSKDQSRTRLAFVGLKSADYDSFDYGRSYGVMHDIEDQTGMLPELGDDSYASTNNFTTGRANGVATYRNTDFFGLVSGLDFAVQHQGNNEGASNGQEGTNNGHDVHHENSDDRGLSIAYDLGMDFSANMAYISSDRTDDQVNHTTAGGDKADVQTAGLKYDTNNIYLVTMYSETRNVTPFGDSDYAVVNKAQSFEVTAQYQFGFGLRLTVSFLTSRGRGLHTADGADNPVGVGDKDLVKCVDIDAICYFNKDMSTYADYRINLLGEDNSFCAANGISTDDIIALGPVYQFRILLPAVMAGFLCSFFLL